jgi:acyl-CoA synthetase (AMP-forming)/AMP-acid ligase II
MQPIAQVSPTALETYTLPELIDHHLKHNPRCTFAVFPGESVGDEPSRISFLEFGRAVQRFARAVSPDAPVNQSETVGIIANCDSLMYMTAIAGLARAGLTVRSSLLMSRSLLTV